ncbi:hypothetical protein [Kitasatospora sp. NPDC091207]|uniref:hypothetical protein n=1 Tax=Kitasatospora sp. NPDC091207 TaxID=3364083 RepID=UPI00380B59DE
MATDPLSKAFVALADPTRRDIVARLSVRDAGVGERAESYAMSTRRSPSTARCWRRPGW